MWLASLTMTAGVGQKDTEPVAVEVNNSNEAGLISVKEAVLEDLEYSVMPSLILYFPRYVSQ